MKPPTQWTDLATLRMALPQWHFEPLGTLGAIAAYPPNGRPCLEAWEALSPHARITGVNGPFYSVNPYLEPRRPDYFS